MLIFTFENKDFWVITQAFLSNYLKQLNKLVNVITHIPQGKSD
jgi:hypothetical protein